MVDVVPNALSDDGSSSSAKRIAHSGRCQTGLFPRSEGLRILGINSIMIIERTSISSIQPSSGPSRQPLAVHRALSTGFTTSPHGDTQMPVPLPVEPCGQLPQTDAWNG